MTAGSISTKASIGDSVKFTDPTGEVKTGTVIGPIVFDGTNVSYGISYPTPNTISITESQLVDDTNVTGDATESTDATKDVDPNA